VRRVFEPAGDDIDIPLEPGVPDPPSRRSDADTAPRTAVFSRSSRDRVLTGVAGGIAERVGVDPVVVRLAFVALSAAGGIGVALYGAGLAVSASPERWNETEPARRTTRNAVAIASIVLGVLLILRELGIWFGDGVAWPVVLAALGSAIIWARGQDGQHRSTRRRFLRRLRVLAGGLLIVSGATAFVASNGAVRVVARNGSLIVAAALVGLAVIVGPLMVRLVRQVTEERRERIRSQERAEVAAHLHDSVLQTLALIQRTGDSRQMASLARSQERELRSWLYGGPAAADHGRLGTALQDVAAEVERAHRVSIDVIVVGDCRIDDGIRALVHACRESMVNAARHSGATTISVFAEVEPDAVTAFVRDQGAGFVKERVPPDRRGIADSIEGRMERNGGTAAVVTQPGRGTEVLLRVPRRAG